MIYAVNISMGIILGFSLIAIYPTLSKFSIEKRIKIEKVNSGGVSTVLSNVYIFFLQLPLIALVFLIIALPIFLNRELFHDDELLTKFAYVISLIFTLLLNFKKFKKWQNEFKHKYLIKCTNCSVLNEIPQFLGQRRELFFYYFLAIQEENKLFCAKCNALLKKSP